MTSSTSTCNAPNAIELRVLLVGRYPHGGDGESRIPVQLFRTLNARGVRVWLIIMNEHTPGRLRRLLPEAADGQLLVAGRFRVTDWIFRIAHRFPNTVVGDIFGRIGDFLDQWYQRMKIVDFVRRKRINVVHQPIPQCPRQPRLLHDVGAPVVLGPVSGFLQNPPWYEERGDVNLRARIWGWIKRAAALPLHRVFPGTPRASVVLVGNPWSARWLPRGLQGRLIDFTDGGVDVDVWRARKSPRETHRGSVLFLTSGRMVARKKFDVTIDAIHRIRDRINALLVIIGDGQPMRARLENQVKALGLTGLVQFTGWCPPEECARKFADCDVFVHSAVNEPGGQVVIEAMACGLPVIGVNWGGVAIRVNTDCGILLAPRNRAEHVEQLAEAMFELASSPEKRRKMGDEARARALREFDWNRRLDLLLPIYEECAVEYAQDTDLNQA